MGLFFKIFHILDKKKAHKDLIEEYSRINKLSSLLHADLKLLRVIQKQIVKKNVDLTEFSRKATGGISLSKTEFIEDELLQKLKELAEKSEQKFHEIPEEIRQSEPLNVEEKYEITRIINFLREIRTKLPDLELHKHKPDKEKLQIIGDALREVTKLAKKFYEIERYEKSLVRRVRENEISALLKRMHSSPERLPQDQSILTYKITDQQLRKLQGDSNRINACKDPKFRIIWSRWWRGQQIPEIDSTTPLKNPHINVTIKLFGRKKKIHLLLEPA